MGNILGLPLLDSLDFIANLELREETKVLKWRCEEAITERQGKVKKRIQEYEEEKNRLQATLKELEADMVDDRKHIAK